MGKTLILTEKESVAQDYARVLNVGTKENGKIENDKYVITWCKGHIVAMSYPEDYDEKYKKWNIQDLPFLPDNFLYHVIVPERYKVIKEQLHRKDIETVLFAGDSGREGEVIYRVILKKTGIRSGMIKKRVWIDSFTDAEIMRGIKEAKPIEHYESLADAGIQRAIEDYLVGINFSRALTCKYGSMFNSKIQSKNWKSIDVGRVMSCVLAMVVERERELESFKEESFYKIHAKITDAALEWKVGETSEYKESPFLYKENGFKKEEKAQEFIEKLRGKKGNIDKIDIFMSNKKAPLLFNLAELQNECSKIFKISPDTTLNTVQSLYENKLTTYPRTDARVLSSAVASEIKRNLEGLKEYEKAKDVIEEILENEYYRSIQKAPYTNDEQITDHYAIIPTGDMSNYNKCTALEKNVYDLIVKRFLSIFYPPACYKNIKVLLKVEGEEFHASSRILLNPGYLKLLNPKEIDEENGEEMKAFGSLKKLKESEIVEIDEYLIKEGKTTPPKRYTSGSMILAMENAGKLIEDDELRQQIKKNGIGTSATRAEILKKLETKEYITVNKKTQIITPHPTGFYVYDILKEIIPDILSPKITAAWEKKLGAVQKGELSAKKHEEDLKNYVADVILCIKNLNNGENYKGEKRESTVYCKCPACKEGDIVNKKGYYVCSTYKISEESCKFIVGKIKGIELSEKDIKDLCEKRKTREISGFKSESGKTFSAYLELTEDNKVKFGFNTFEATCPKCGGTIRKISFGYGCSNYKNGDEQSCDFRIAKKIKEKEITQKQIEKLLKNKKTDLINGFKSKTGKNFSAYLVLDENCKLKFELYNKKD